MHHRATLVLIMALVSGGCGVGDLLTPDDVAIRVVPDSLHLLIGELGRLEARDGDGDVIASRAVEWTSYGRAIAEVTGEGEVVGIGPGRTAVVARHRDVQATASVTIEELPFVQVVTGRLHSCARLESGEAYCWGENGHGQLGSTAGGWICGDNDPCHLKPAAVQGGLAFSDLSVGSEHSCGVAAGAVFCWGSNARGQLGVAGPAEGSNPMPVEAATDVALVDVEAGSDHTCALTSDGEALCWGLNDEGQLGNGTRDTKTTPTPVVGGLRFAELAGGRKHTCGITDSGTTYCWGRNGERQLGTPEDASSTVPVAVWGSHTYTAIDAGHDHTCAVTTEREVRCWGRNGQGQVGDGTTFTRPLPTLVAGGHRFRAIAAGGFHSCGVVADGRLFCWGWNGYRQLGTDRDTPLESAVPLAVASDGGYSAIDAGWLHTCSTGSGVTHCWGYNGAGQLGRPDIESRCITETVQRCALAPVPVLGSR